MVFGGDFFGDGGFDEGGEDEAVLEEGCDVVFEAAVDEGDGVVEFEYFTEIRSGFEVFAGFFSGMIGVSSGEDERATWG